MLDSEISSLDVLRADLDQLLDEVVVIATPPVHPDKQAALEAAAGEIGKRFGSLQHVWSERQLGDALRRDISSEVDVAPAVVAIVQAAVTDGDVAAARAELANHYEHLLLALPTVARSELAEEVSRSTWDRIAVRPNDRCIAIRLPDDFPVTADQLSRLIALQQQLEEETRHSSDPLPGSLVFYTILLWLLLATGDTRTSVGFRDTAGRDAFVAWWSRLSDLRDEVGDRVRELSAQRSSEDFQAAVRAAEQLLPKLQDTMPRLAALVEAWAASSATTESAG